MSSFADAISASMVAGLDPMNSMVRDYAGATVKQVKSNTVGTKLDMVERIHSVMKQDDIPSSIQQAYDDLLAELKAI